MLETMVFAKKPDGKIVLVGDWPREVEFSRELLDLGGPLIVTDDGYVECSVYNGCAFYKITGKRGGTGIVEPMYEVVSARLINSFIGFDR